MSLPKKLLTLAAPAALLALSACATGFPAQVSRFQAIPAPQGQSFVVQAARAEDRGGLEFSRYADLVERNLIAEGYVEASSPQTATFVVTLDYGVDNGREKIVTRPGGFSRFGYGGFYDPFFPRFGFHGRHSPFYYGWNDPFWYSPRGGGGTVIFTVSPERPGKLVNIASTRFGTSTGRSSVRERACAVPSNSDWPSAVRLMSMSR